MIDRLLLAGRFLGRIFRRFAEENFGRTSASLAYTTLLSIVPLVAVVLGAMSAMPSFLLVVDQLEQVVRNMLPERSAGMIIEYVLDFSQKALNVTVIGLLALAVTALALLHTVEQAFNTVWKTAKKRSWWRRIALYAALILLWPLAVMYVVAAVSFAVSLSSGLVIEPLWLHKLLSKATGALVAAVFFAALYFVVPNAKVKLLDALFGGCFAAFGFFLMQRGFELYLAYFPSVTLVYGTFATVPIFLLWLYLSWAMILLGALVVVTLPEFRRENQPPPSRQADTATPLDIIQREKNRHDLFDRKTP
ncbi:MAG: YihY family inner membrane protein [Candidatus Accumulibacter sp.]|jgi:membrane protein|nr:YihY family inner membrane protein [Accumulibacter sp.]